MWAIFLWTAGGPRKPNPFVCFYVSLDAGDEIIIPEPFTLIILALWVEAGVTIIPVTSFILIPVLPCRRFLEDFEKKITAGIQRRFLICNPNNPTGYLYSKVELES